MWLLSIIFLVLALVSTGFRIALKNEVVREDPFLTILFRVLSSVCVIIVIALSYHFGIVKEEQMFWPVVFAVFGLMVDYIYRVLLAFVTVAVLFFSYQKIES